MEPLLGVLPIIGRQGFRYGHVCGDHLSQPAAECMGHIGKRRGGLDRGRSEHPAGTFHMPGEFTVKKTRLSHIHCIGPEERIILDQHDQLAPEKPGLPFGRLLSHGRGAFVDVFK